MRGEVAYNTCTFTFHLLKMKKKEEAKHHYSGLKIWTNIALSPYVWKEHCSYDMEYYNWSSKMCHHASTYDSETELTGHIVSNRLGQIPLPDMDFRGKKILFMGDSHMRGLSTSFLYHVYIVCYTENYKY